jgi:lipopolysaccharide transport system permease protein
MSVNVLQAKPVHEIAARRRWMADIAELWQFRHLVLLLALRSIRVRYKQTILGLLWAVIAPVAFTSIFVLFFQLVPVRPSNDLPYVPTVFAGMVLWQFFSRGLTEAGVSLTANSNLITKVYFPRMALPLSAIVASLADVLINMVLLGVLLAWYGIVPTGKILLAPLFVGQVFVLVLACGIWMSAIDGLFRDFRHALPLLLQLGMFVSPVAYTTAALVPQQWYWLYALNPMVSPLEGFRWSLMASAPPPDLGMLAVNIAVTLLLLLSGTMFFARVERLIVDHV